MSIEEALEYLSYIKRVVGCPTLSGKKEKTCDTFTCCSNLQCFKFIQVCCCMGTNSGNIELYLVD